MTADFRKLDRLSFEAIQPRMCALIRKLIAAPWDEMESVVEENIRPLTDRARLQLVLKAVVVRATLLERSRRGARCSNPPAS